jgi:adenylate kinase
MVGRRIVFLGPPGAGKGTQCSLLSRQLDIPHVSTGQILRSAVGAGSKLGQLVKGFLDAGDLVPDDLMIKLIRERLKEADCSCGFILDGFPRTIEQARQLDSMLALLKLTLTDVVEIVVSESELKTRLLERAAQEGRSDDTAEVVGRRLEIYRSSTIPVSEYYRNKGSRREVNGIGSIEEVSTRIKSALG